MRRFLVLAVLGVAFVCSCGDEPTGTPITAPPANEGIFVDAPCAGLDYVAARGTSDEISGVTDASGTFTYVPGNNVEFRIGGISLGEAPAASLLSPIHLRGVSGVIFDDVTNIARFLQTLDDDADASNGIQVTAAVRAAAAVDSLYFFHYIAAFESDSIVTDVISRLTAETQAGERPLVPVAEAQENLRSGVRAAYEGTYNGYSCRSTNKGWVSTGTWTMEVGPNGEVTITFRGNPSFTVTGFMNMNGTVTIFAPGGDVRASFAPTFGGSWVWDGGHSGGVFGSGPRNCPLI